MAKSKRMNRRRRRKREALVFQHMERVSRKLLDDHPDVVRDFIGRNAGIYALYRRDRLYYIGLANQLSSRLKAHKRNRHGKAWDHFSIYLTIKDQHLKEIECLLLQMAQPRGNKVGGKPLGSRDMRRSVLKAVHKKQRASTVALFGHTKRSGAQKLKSKPARDDISPLRKLFPVGARLHGLLKGRKYVARARRDGRIRYKGRVYDSLSSAARAAVGRRFNGWRFWRAQRGRGNWERLSKLRRAGTAVYPP